MMHVSLLVCQLSRFAKQPSRAGYCSCGFSSSRRCDGKGCMKVNTSEILQSESENTSRVRPYTLDLQPKQTSVS